jgi:hypothetical protein
MRVVMGFLLMSLIVTVLVLTALAQLIITLAPFLAVALLVLLVLRLLRHRNPAVSAAPVDRAYGARARVRAAGKREYRVGAPAAAPEGWVLVPVWVAPARPEPTVIDAEVINEDG